MFHSGYSTFDKTGCIVHTQNLNSPCAQSVPPEYRKLGNEFYCAYLTTKISSELIAWCVVQLDGTILSGTVVPEVKPIPKSELLDKVERFLRQFAMSNHETQERIFTYDICENAKLFKSKTIPDSPTGWERGYFPTAWKFFNSKPDSDIIDGIKCHIVEFSGGFAATPVDPVFVPA